MRKTTISKLRSTGKGIKGTYENIDCHAQGIEVFAKALEPMIPHLGFVTWKQGSNVHQFETIHGKNYTLRPVWVESEGENPARVYNGVALSLRVSRSQEYVLTHCTRITDIPRLVEMMRMLAKSQPGNVGDTLDRD